MLLKLNFTAAKPMYQIFRMVTDIINTDSVTSISTLQARATSAGYDSSLLANLDTTNSFINRANTLTTSKTRAHYSGNTYTKVFTCTLEFSVYDNPSTKYYTNFTSSTYPTIVQTVGASISGGTMDSSQMSVTELNGDNFYFGTVLTIGTNADTFTPYTADVYCLWLYITDAGMVHCATMNAATTSGFPGTFNSNTYYQGPWIVSQYARADYWNKASNNILPVVYSGSRGSGIGFGISTYDFATSAGNYYNTEYTTADVIALKVYQLVDTRSTTNIIDPKTTGMYYNKKVAHRVAGISPSGQALSASTISTLANDASFRELLNQTANYKVPNDSLTTAVYGQNDFGWCNDRFLVSGGSMSEVLGIYIFNGDYTAGNEYLVGSTVYIILPLYAGVSTRIGIGIPKEGAAAGSTLDAATIQYSLLNNTQSVIKPSSNTKQQGVWY